MEKILEAEAFLIERENKLSNTQSNRSNSGKISEPFSRGKLGFQKLFLEYKL